MQKKLVVKLDDFFRGEVKLKTGMPATQQFRLPSPKKADQKVESEFQAMRFSAPFACFDADYDSDYDYDYDWDWSWDYDWGDDSYDWYDVDDSGGTVTMDGEIDLDSEDSSNKEGQNDEIDWDDWLDWDDWSDWDDDFDPGNYDVHISGPTVRGLGGGGGG